MNESSELYGRALNLNEWTCISEQSGHLFSAAYHLITMLFWHVYCSDFTSRLLHHVYFIMSVVCLDTAGIPHHSVRGAVKCLYATGGKSARQNLQLHCVDCVLMTERIY